MKKEEIKMSKEDEINHAIGSLIVKEKYKFLPTGLLGEICKDFVEELETE